MRGLEATPHASENQQNPTRSIKMNDESFANALENELEANIAASPEPALRVVPKKDTLLGQWTMLERIETELRARIRREELAIKADYDREFARLNSLYDQRISDSVAALEAERRLKLRDLVDATADRLRDHDTLRRGRLEAK
jgi:hypothetical protein